MSVAQDPNKLVAWSVSVALVHIIYSMVNLHWILQLYHEELCDAIGSWKWICIYGVVIVVNCYMIVALVLQHHKSIFLWIAVSFLCLVYSTCNYVPSSNCQYSRELWYYFINFFYVIMIFASIFTMINMYLSMSTNNNFVELARKYKKPNKEAPKPSIHTRMPVMNQNDLNVNGESKESIALSIMNPNVIMPDMTIDETITDIGI